MATGLVALLLWNTLFPERKVIYLPTTLIDEQVEVWQSQLGRRLNQHQLRTLINTQIEQQVLYQEALDRGFEYSLVVQRRLTRLARFLVSEQQPDVEQVLTKTATHLLKNDSTIRNYLVNAAENALRSEQQIPTPTKAQIVDYYHANEVEYSTSEWVQISHVYVGGNTANSQQQALQIRSRIVQEKPLIEKAIHYGSVYYGGHHQPQKTYQQMSDSFGRDFAHEVWKLTPQQWSDPIASAFGWHLVWVVQRVESQLKSLAQVQETIRDTLIRQALDRRMTEVIVELKDQYQVVVSERYQQLLNDES
jgi:parvulin-like peptidyl-prolyl isomerase